MLYKQLKEIRGVTDKPSTDQLLPPPKSLETVLIDNIR